MCLCCGSCCVLFILCVGVCVTICYIFFIVYIYTVLRVMIYEVCYTMAVIYNPYLGECLCSIGMILFFCTESFEVL